MKGEEGIERNEEGQKEVQKVREEDLRFEMNRDGWMKEEAEWKTERRKGRNGGRR